jgi:opine dehydrogenase
VKQYGADVADTTSLKAIFNTNKGYVGCNTPMKEVPNRGFVPLVNSRLFDEDIPFGLCILKNLAEMLGNFPTPKIDQLIEWHQQFMGKQFLVNGQLNPKLLVHTGAPKRYNLKNLDDVVRTSLSSKQRRSRL